jgi:hypothetical protein
LLNDVIIRVFPLSGKKGVNTPGKNACRIHSLSRARNRYPDGR